MPGNVRAVAVGADGSIWALGTVRAGPGGFSIYRWNGVTAWDLVPGAAKRLSVGPDGNAWVVNQQRLIYQWDGSQWQPHAGLAEDIGVGADGSVWALGVTPASFGNFTIYRMNRDGTWEQVSGAAVRIAVGPDGNALVVNRQGQLFRWTGTQWDPFPYLFYDAEVGPDGSIWALSPNGDISPPTATSFGSSTGVYLWNGVQWQALQAPPFPPAGTPRILVPGQVGSIAVDPTGLPLVTDPFGRIFRRV